MSRETADPALTAFLDEREQLLALARAVVGNASIAEDLVQDSWLRWAGRRYANEDARPILRRIVSNLANDWHRRRSTERRSLETQKLGAASAPDSEQVIIAKQDLQTVALVLSELPERTLNAFRMCRIDGMTYAEIGRRLGVSTTRAHQLVGAALVHLAVRLPD